jgi:hypothetical protein
MKIKNARTEEGIKYQQIVEFTKTGYEHILVDECRDAKKEIKVLRFLRSLGFRAYPKTGYQREEVMIKQSYNYSLTHLATGWVKGYSRRPAKPTRQEIGLNEWDFLAWDNRENCEA